MRLYIRRNRFLRTGIYLKMCASIVHRSEYLKRHTQAMWFYLQMVRWTIVVDLLEIINRIGIPSKCSLFSDE